MRYLTKSRFKQALECPDKLYYSGRKSEYADNRKTNEFLRELAKGGIQVGELAKSYFPSGVEVETLDNEDALAKTLELLRADNITIFEAAIAFENLLVRVDVLEKKGNTLYLYEAKSKSFRTEDDIFKKKGGIKADFVKYAYDIAFQLYVARKAFTGSTVHGSLFLIDKKKVCSVEGLFQKFLVRNVDGRYKVITNPAGDIGDPILTRVDLGNHINNILLGTEELPSGQHSFESYVSTLATAYRDQSKLNAPVSPACKNCEYKATESEKANGLKSGYEECWSAKVNFKSLDFVKPSIFEIWKIKSEDFLSQGRYHIANLKREDFASETTTSKRLIPPHERQWMQVERVHRPELGAYIDSAGIETELRKIRYPIHFIDFEATRNAIPYVKGIRPYAQLAFQFSNHTLDEDGKLVHDQWIETRRGQYPSFDFLRNLKSQLSRDNGSICIYSNFENAALLEIHDMLAASSQPDKDELISFIKEITWTDKEARGVWSGPRRMIDLKDWVMDYYYSPLMKGSNSIKVVLPAIIAESRYVREIHPEWIKFDARGQLINPYDLLPPVFDDYDRQTLDLLSEDDDLADGGAAMCAFNLMQFSEMSDGEKEKVIQALLLYCKLDTLAMVMLFEGLSHFGN